MKHITAILAASLAITAHAQAQTHVEPTVSLAIGRYETGGAKATAIGPSAGIIFHSAGMLEAGIEFTATRAGREHYQFLEVPLGIRFSPWKRTSITPFAAPYAGQHYFRDPESVNTDKTAVPPLAAFFSAIDREHQQIAGVIVGIRLRTALTKGSPAISLLAEPSYTKNWNGKKGNGLEQGFTFKAGILIKLTIRNEWRKEK